MLIWVNAVCVGKCSTLESRFLFAKCCFKLNKLQEAEMALVRDLKPENIQMDKLDIGGKSEERFHESSADRFEVHADPEENTDPSDSSGRKEAEALKNLKTCEDFLGDTSGFAYALLGDICRKASRLPQAIVYYRKSLEINPFLWSSYEALCQCADDVDPFTIFNTKRCNVSSYPVCSNGVNISGKASNDFEFAKPDNPAVNGALFARRDSFQPQNTPFTPTVLHNTSGMLCNLSFALEIQHLVLGLWECLRLLHPLHLPI